MTVRIAIDPNVRVKGNQAMAGFEDADGMVAKGDEVEIYEAESGLCGTATVNEIDGDRRLIYMITDWSALRVPITEAEYAAALPGRMQKIADQLSEGLPEGMRFEWDT